MKKSFFLILVAAALSVLGLKCCKTDDWESDLDRAQLKGKVKTVTIKFHKAIMKFGEPVINGYEFPTPVRTIYYDEIGMKYRGIGFDTLGQPTWSDSSVLDKSKLKIVKFWRGKGKEDIVSHDYLNERGQAIRCDYFDKIGNPNGKTFYYYENGNLSKVESFDKDGKPEAKIISKNYTLKYCPKITERYEAGSELYSTETNKYDEEGRRIQFEAFYPKNNYQFKRTYTYEDIDEKGNWTKEIAWIDKDNAIIITIRRIEYYDK